MPNWCNNTLRISGDKEVVSRIKDWYKQSDKTDVGLFGIFYPLPSELKDTTAPSPEENKTLIEKYGADNWYDWQTKNWGCKWDAGEVCLVVETENEICLSFDTPWGPPITFYEKLSEDYPKLKIRASYYEGGMDFCGTFHSNGRDETFSISDIRLKCLETYRNTYKDSVDEFDFRERLENIYIDSFPISKDIGVYEIFDDYYFEENLDDADFCKQYNIQIEKENQ